MGVEGWQKTRTYEEHRLHSRTISYMLWFLPNLHRVYQETKAKSSGRSCRKRKGGETPARAISSDGIIARSNHAKSTWKSQHPCIVKTTTHTTLWHTRCVCVCVCLCVGGAVVRRLSGSKEGGAFIYAEKKKMKSCLVLCLFCTT